MHKKSLLNFSKRLIWQKKKRRLNQVKPSKNEKFTRFLLSKILFEVKNYLLIFFKKRLSNDFILEINKVEIEVINEISVKFRSDFYSKRRKHFYRVRIILYFSQQWDKFKIRTDNKPTNFRLRISSWSSHIKIYYN